MAGKKMSGKGKAQGKNAKAAPAQSNREEMAIGPAEEMAITADDPAAAPAVLQDNPPAEKKPKAGEAGKAEKAAAAEKPAQAPAVGPDAPPAVEKAPKSAPKDAAAATTGPRMPAGISQRPLMADSGNPYLPKMATVLEVIDETANIRTLRLVLDEGMDSFTFEPGQVGQISVFGAGEATFVINSPPSQKNYLQFSVMKTGEATDAIHRLSEGDTVGLRAPLGNFFPYQQWRGKNVFFIGGGIGMAPIRTIMLHLLENSGDYGKISLLYGARSPRDMAYSYELDAWKNNPHLDCTLCIDNPYEDWGHKVGLIPSVLEEIGPSPDNTVAVLCGPPIMIKFTLQTLQKLGFAPENIVTTLEKRMKCGIGICGRCNIGDRYVCVDGPVFTLAELNGLPPDL